MNEDFAPPQCTQEQLDLLKQRSSLILQAQNISIKYNTFAPIFIVPLEVLHNIFSLLVNRKADPSLRGGDRDRVWKQDPSRNIRVVSQVCRPWRTIALESPSLWDVPLDCSATPYRWGLELIRRSSPLPLTVIVDCGQGFRHWMPNFRRYVLQNIDRIENLLALNFPPRTLFDFVLKRLHRDAPALRSLYIKGEAYGDYDNDFPDQPEDNDVSYSSGSETGSVSGTDSDEGDVFLSDFPDGHPTHLQSLRTFGYVFRAESAIYNNLSSLRVTAIRGSSAFTVATWFSVLQRMENLVSLTLEDCIRKAENESIPAVSFPNLKHFGIVGSMEPDGIFIKHFFKTTVPTLHSLHITIRRIPVEGVEFHELVDTIVRLLKKYATRASRRTLSTYLDCSKVSISDRPFIPKSDYSLKIRLRLQRSNGSLTQIIPALQEFTTSDQHRDYLRSSDVYPLPSQQVLAALVAPFVGLTGLQISCRLSFAGLDVEEEDFDRFDPSRFGMPMFPLSLPEVTDLAVSMVQWDSPSWHTSLKDVLEWRFNAGTAVKTLGFRANPPAWRRPEVQDLEEIVSEIVWVKKSGREMNADIDLDSDDSLKADLASDLYYDSQSP